MCAFGVVVFIRGRWVYSVSLGSFMYALEFVGFIGGNLFAPCGSLSSLGVVGFIRLVVIGFIRLCWVHLGAPCSVGVVWIIKVVVGFIRRR